MYLKYFGLTTFPFKTTPDLDMFYKMGTRAEILHALTFTLERGDAFVKVTGEVGSGKTMILRLLATNLVKHNQLIYINSPNLSAKDILLNICSDLNIETAGVLQKFDLINLIKTKLLNIHSHGKRVIMLIDEAQAMTLDALEEVRLLSNLETDQDKLIQIAFFGQPELDDALEHKKIRQLKSRISYSIYVPPLSSKDVQAYLNYRMRKAGYTGLDVFDYKVSKKITAYTGGLPRNINIIADKVLMYMYGAGAKKAKKKYLEELSDIQKKTSFLDFFIRSITVAAVVTIVLFLSYKASQSWVFFQKHMFFWEYKSVLSEKNQPNVEISENGVEDVEKKLSTLENKEGFNEAHRESPFNAKGGLTNSGTVSEHDSKEVVTFDKQFTENNKNINYEIDKKINKDSLPEVSLDKNKELSKSIKNSIVENNKVTKKLSLNIPVNNLKASELSLVKPKKNKTIKVDISQVKWQEMKKTSLNKKNLLTLLKYHVSGEQWLKTKSLEYRYMIQLVVRNPRYWKKIIDLFKNNSLDHFILVLDYNQKYQDFRVTAFYEPSNSFIFLQKAIQNLPPSIRRASPFVVENDEINKHIRYTNDKLEQLGILFHE